MKVYEYMRMRDSMQDSRRMPPRNSRGEFTRRDRGYDDRDERERDYARDERRDRGYGMDERRDRGYDEEYRDERRDRNYGRDERRDREYRDERRDRNYGRDERRDRGYDDYDSEYEMEYNDMRMLDRHTIEKWMEKLENADGSRGAKFSKEQIRRVTEQHGVKFQKFSEDEFRAAVNMMYSDYCRILGSDVGIYVKMAREFLEDPDAGVKGGEKLAAYYHCIVEA